jgi:hypothetical protein
MMDFFIRLKIKCEAVAKIIVCRQFALFTFYERKNDNCNVTSLERRREFMQDFTPACFEKFIELHEDMNKAANSPAAENKAIPFTLHLT